MKKYADIKIMMTIAFDDDGEIDLKDQAIHIACKVVWALLSKDKAP